jgi:GT2 family glycosyltransferase
VPRSRAARPAPAPAGPFVTVVIATRNRVRELFRTLAVLAQLPEQPTVVVVDNASTDGTPEAVRERYPEIEVIALPRNRGACARNVGVAIAPTPHVAFSDDDSWWEPGSLRRAVMMLEDFPEVGLVAARTLVGSAGTPDPVNAAMRESPLPCGQLPGPRVLGFLACAAVVRRAAFLAVGGFNELLFIGAEERLLALDLAAAGWGAAYVDEVVARHWPSAARDETERRRLLARNEVLIDWLRRPAATALAATGRLVLRARTDRAAAGAIASLLPVLPFALLQRRVMPPHVEAQVRLLDSCAELPLSQADTSRGADRSRRLGPARRVATCDCSQQGGT